MKTPEAHRGLERIFVGHDSPRYPHLNPHIRLVSSTPAEIAQRTGGSIHFKNLLPVVIEFPNATISYEGVEQYKKEFSARSVTFRFRDEREVVALEERTVILKDGKVTFVLGGKRGEPIVILEISETDGISESSVMFDLTERDLLKAQRFAKNYGAAE